jgi:hypothetical protein
MGLRPGVASGFREGPAAIVGGKPVRIRKITNHMFIGPDHSIVHPGLFPHHPEAAELADLQEWLTFDHEAGWGTESFERSVPGDHPFPERWAYPEDRADARAIVEENLALLEIADRARVELLRAGYGLGSVELTRASSDALLLTALVTNRTDGHNVPTGFIAERLVYLRVEVRDRSGERIFVSGDLDPNGDLRDRHSLYVKANRLERDASLFNLQSKFLVASFHGPEVERVLAIDDASDPLPFLRPATRSNILTGTARGVRIHRQSIEPGGRRQASYRVEGAPPERGPFRATVKLVAGMVPVHLVAEIAGVGFDYGLSPRQVADRVVAGHRVLAERIVTTAPSPPGDRE